MKQKFLLKTMLLLCALIVGGVSSTWATTTYQHVFNAKPSTGNNIILSSVKWNIEETNLGSYNSGNYAGVQIGTSKANGSITLTSSAAWGEETGTYQGKTVITEVRLWLNLGGTSVTPSVTIDGVSATSDGTTVVKNSSAGTDWTKATKVTFTPATNGRSGSIVINVATVKAGYICAMEIDCEEPAPTPITHTLTYSATNGSISGIDAGSNAVASGASVAEGATVTLTATPADGYEFSSWSDGGDNSTLSSTTANPTTFTMSTADATVTANFVAAATVTALAVKTAPTKLNYKVGETLDLTGLVLDATIGGNHVDVTTGYTASPANGATLNSVRAQTVTFTYGGQTTTQTIHVGELDHIAITTAPTKTTYYEGQTFDPTGMVVTATFTDGDESPTVWTEDVTEDCTFDPETNTALNTYDTEVTVSYGWGGANRTADQAITVTTIPTHTAQFSVNGTIDNNNNCTVAEGAAITFPSNPADIYGKSFVGWTTSAINGTEESYTALTPEDKTMGSADKTFYAVFADVEGSSETKQDALTSSVTGITTSSYDNFSDKSVSNGSNAKYAGNCAGSNTYIQLRTSSNTGLVSTTSGGKAKKVTLAWSSTSDRALQVYGSNTAYTGLSDIFDDDKKGSLLGTLTYNSDTELSITGDYAYIGIKPDAAKSGASQLSSITIDWEVSNLTYSNYCTTVAAPVDVTGVTLDQNSATLEVGDTETLTATVAPDNATNKNVTWESDDETVATVKDGVVTAVGVGSATITVISVADNTKTATCTVTVNPTAVTGVSVDATATVKVGKTTTLTATVSPENATNKNVTWASSNTAIATVSEAGVVTGVAAGEATITVTSVSDNTKTATCTVTVLAAGTGTKANPYDVAEAIEKIDGGKGTDLTGKYVKGIITKIDRVTVDGNAQYWISDDGETQNQFEVYNGYYYDGENFTSSDAIKVGDVVIVFGNLTYYSKNSVNEFAGDNYIYSLNGVKIPEITFDEESYDVNLSGSLTITATADCSGTITYTSSDTNIAEINSTTGVVTPKAIGEVTITANIAASVDNIAGSKTVILTVSDGRAPAGIAFEDESMVNRWGEVYTSLALANPNNLSVSYASSNTDVATVDEGTGELTILKAGETDITATFAGDEDFMPAEVSYHLYVLQAVNGLRYEPTAFDIALNDNSFETPTLINPHNLTVTYTSSNEAVAMVDEDTGYLVLETSAVGTATITATFAGNDWYEEGSASYTINIIDPTVIVINFNNNDQNISESYEQAATLSYTIKGVKLDFAKTGSATNPRVDGESYTNTLYARIYKDNTLTITGINNANIKSISFDFNKGSLTNNATTYSSSNTTWTGNAHEVIFTGAETTFINSISISYSSESVTLGTNGYTTFASPLILDLTEENLPEGVTAYKAAVSGTTVTFTALDQTVPANTGVLLKGEASATVSIPVAVEGTEVTDNEFLVNAAGTTFNPGDTDTYYYFGLMKNTLTFGVFDPTTVAIPANKAYLKVLKSSIDNQARLNVMFNDDASGIRSIDHGQLIIDNAVYNLQGRRVENPRKGGLYIMNGKKVVF